MDGVELVAERLDASPPSARSWLVTTADGTASGRARLRARVCRSGVSTTTAWHGTPAAAASARYRARTAASRAVESMTVSSPRARRLAMISSRTSRASRGRPQVVAVAADDGPQVVGRHHRRRVERTRRPTSTCPIRPCRRARRGTDRAGGWPPGNTRAPPVHDRTMIFTTRCAGCDAPGATLCRTCRFALLGPPPLGRRRACSSPRRSPAGCATSCSGSSTATGGRSPATSPACSSTGSPGPASGSTSSPGRRRACRRRRQRGFDQAELVARQVARQLGVPCRRLLERAGRRAGADRAGPRGPTRRPGVPGPPAGAGGVGSWSSTTS